MISVLYQPDLIYRNCIILKKEFCSRIYPSWRGGGTLGDKCVCHSVPHNPIHWISTGDANHYMLSSVRIDPCSAFTFLHLLFLLYLVIVIVFYFLPFSLHTSCFMHLFPVHLAAVAPDVPNFSVFFCSSSPNPYLHVYPLTGPVPLNSERLPYLLLWKLGIPFMYFVYR